MKFLEGRPNITGLTKQRTRVVTNSVYGRECTMGNHQDRKKVQGDPLYRGELSLRLELGEVEKGVVKTVLTRVTSYDRSRDSE